MVYKFHFLMLYFTVVGDIISFIYLFLHQLSLLLSLSFSLNVLTTIYMNLPWHWLYSFGPDWFPDSGNARSFHWDPVKPRASLEAPPKWPGDLNPVGCWLPKGPSRQSLIVKKGRWKHTPGSCPVLSVSERFQFCLLPSHASLTHFIRSWA